MSEEFASDWRVDGAAEYTHAIRCARERGVRAGNFPPQNADERRQAAEGPMPYALLDANKQ